ncbi:hypothetical protein ACIBBB_07360 [Streptomyces sp. NPDC051217]
MLFSAESASGHVTVAGHYGMVTHAVDVLSAVTGFLDRHSEELRPE